MARPTRGELVVEGPQADARLDPHPATVRVDVEHARHRVEGDLHAVGGRRRGERVPGADRLDPPPVGAADDRPRPPPSSAAPPARPRASAGSRPSSMRSSSRSRIVRPPTEAGGVAWPACSMSHASSTARATTTARTPAAGRSPSRTGVAVKLRGRADHPFSQGELCPKVNRFLDRVYSPERLLHPLRRVGPKGEGRFAPISWDDALAEIGERLHDVVARHGGEAILPFSDAGNQSLLSVMGLDGRFFHHLGASRLLRAICGPTVGHGVRMTNGSGLGLDPLELRHSRLILLWGTNTRLTNRHLWPTIEAARADGAKVVVIDPIRTITAEAADEFVQPLPGTDIALMLAMMHVLVRDGLVDTPWVEAHTLGFPELAAHVADWTPARAAAICGLDAGGDRAARRRLRHDPPGGHPHPDRRRAPRERGDVLPHAGGPPGPRRCLARPRRRALPQRRLVPRRARRRGRPDPARPAARVDAAAAQHEPPRRGAHRPRPRPAGGGDDRVERQPVGHRAQRRAGPPRPRPRRPVHGRPRAVPHRHGALRRHRAAGHDPAREHRRRPGVGAPVDGLERGGDRPASARRAATPSCSAGCPAPWASTSPPCSTTTRRCWRRPSARRSTSPSCARVGWVRVPYADDGRPWGSGVFPTPSGKVELVSETLGRLGQPVLPTFVAPREGPHGDAELHARYPLQLLTPKHHSRFLNSGYSHLPKHGPAEGAPFVELDAADAGAPGIVDGDDGPRVERPGECRAAGADHLAPAAAASSSSRGGGGRRSTPTASRPTP